MQLDACELKSRVDLLQLAFKLFQVLAEVNPSERYKPVPVILDIGCCEAVYLRREALGRGRHS
jgi:hypothetical protein